MNQMVIMLVISRMVIFSSAVLVNTDVIRVSVALRDVMVLCYLLPIVIVERGSYNIVVLRDKKVGWGGIPAIVVIMNGVVDYPYLRKIEMIIISSGKIELDALVIINQTLALIIGDILWVVSGIGKPIRILIDDVVQDLLDTLVTFSGESFMRDLEMPALVIAV